MKRLGALALACAIVASAAPSLALDLSEWIPNLRLTPFFSEKVEYESNVLQVPSGAQGSVIFKTIPGFLADYGRGTNSFSLGYKAEILNYVSLPEQDTVNHFAVGQIHLEFNRLKLNLRDDFKISNEPPGTELTGPIGSTTNVLNPSAEYQLTSRISVGPNFSWTYISYDQVVDFIDRNEYLIGPSVFYKITPRADVSLNYSYGWKDFTNDSSRNVTQHIVTVGLRGDLTSKISSSFRVGYEKRDPDNSGNPGYSGWVAGGDWVYRPTDRTTFTLVTERSIQESTFANEPYYITTSAGLGIQHYFTPKLSVTIRGAGGENDYPLKETLGGKTKWRNDFFYLAGGAVNYDIQPWLAVGIEYTKINRRSNFSVFSFDDDKVAGYVTLQF